MYKRFIEYVYLIHHRNGKYPWYIWKIYADVQDTIYRLQKTLNYRKNTFTKYKKR